MLSLIVAGTFTILLGLDVLLKQHVEETIRPGEEKELPGGKVVIRKVYNKGFLLNSLESHPALIKTVSILAGACLHAARGHLPEKDISLRNWAWLFWGQALPVIYLIGYQEGRSLIISESGVKISFLQG